MTAAFTVWRSCIDTVSMAHAMSHSSEPMSGTRTSRSGPITSSRHEAIEFRCTGMRAAWATLRPSASKTQVE